MEYLNIIYLVSIFLIPCGSFLFLWLRPENKRANEVRTVGMVTYIFLLLLSLVRMVMFSPADVATYALMGISFSKELEFSLTLDRERILVLSGISYLIFNQYFHHSILSVMSNKRLLSYFYILFAYTATALSVLSEKILVSIMFIELALFSMHAYLLLSDVGARALETVSYFKRNVFIFGGLFLMLGMSWMGFDSGFILITGVTLYSLSIICGRQIYSESADIFVQMFSQFCAAFIFWRVFQLGVQNTDKTLDAWIFIFMGMVFSGLSFFSTKKISALYWYSVGILSFIFSLKISSKNPDSINFLFIDVLFILQLFNSYLLSAVKINLDGGAKTAGNYFAITIQFASHFFQLALPLTLLGLLLADISLPLTLGVAHIGMIFLSTAAYAKFCFGVKFSSREQAWSAPTQNTAILPALNGFLYMGLNVLVTTGVIVLDPNKTLMSLDRSLSALELLSVIGVPAALIIGILAGVLLPKTNWLRERARKVEQKREFDSAPNIDPKFILVGAFLVNAPPRILELLIAKLSAGISTLSLLVIRTEKSLTENILIKELRAGVVGSSRFIRQFHNGFLRSYVLMSSLIILLIAMYFVFH